MKPQNESKSSTERPKVSVEPIRFDDDREFRYPVGDLFGMIAIAMVIAIICALATGCATPSAPEPKWVPELRLNSMENGCEWVDEMGGSIACDDPALSGFALIPLESLYSNEEKMQRCERWR